MRACVHSCVRACHSRAQSIYMCAQVRISRMRTRSARWETLHFTMIKIPPAGQPVTNPLFPCRRVRNGCIIHPPSPSPSSPPPATVAEFRLCTESFLKIIPGLFAEFARVQQSNSRGDCSFRTHLFERTHTVEDSRSFRTAVLFSCSYKLEKRETIATRNDIVTTELRNFFTYKIKINTKIARYIIIIKKD